MLKKLEYLDFNAKAEERELVNMVLRGDSREKLEKQAKKARRMRRVYQDFLLTFDEKKGGNTE